MDDTSSQMSDNDEGLVIRSSSSSPLEPEFNERHGHCQKTFDSSHRDALDDNHSDGDDTSSQMSDNYEV